MSSPSIPSRRTGQRWTGLLAAVAVAPLVVACAPQGAATEAGGTPLTPRFSAEPDAGSPGPEGVAGRRTVGPRQDDAESAAATPPTATAPTATAPTATARPDRGPSVTATPGPAPTTNAPAAGPVQARVRDAGSDVTGVGAPAHVDLLGAVLSRTGSSMTLRVEVGGDLPARQTDSRTQNIVLFVDLQGDGQVDHELWAALADDGWSTSHRRPDGAAYGAESGVTARAAGSSLVLGFTADHLGGARAFRWAVGTEWGTLEQVATGTTAQDLAPDTGSVGFPG